MSEITDDLPFYLRYFISFLNYFPPINTTKGLFAFSTFVYFIYMVILAICAIYNRKDTAARINDETEFKKNLEELRKVKSADANKLLNNLYGNKQGKEN